MSHGAVEITLKFSADASRDVLFAERDGTRSASQIMAFEDTWEWNMDAERAYEEIVERDGRVSDAMRVIAANPIVVARPHTA
ncbi:MAG: hypothetical protein WAN76_21415 [Candidatus Sulfotelmatobacter sp.]